VRAVKQMLALREALLKAKTGRQQTALQRRITATENRIDQLVFELYGVTEHEISLVEILKTKLAKRRPPQTSNSRAGIRRMNFQQLWDNSDEVPGGMNTAP